MKSGPGDLPTIRFGVFELDPSAGELHKQGLKVRLQEQPLRILQILLESRGRLVTREELQTALWPSHSYVDFDQGLNRAINKLREALGDSAESPRFIETLAKRGYRFLVHLERPKESIRSLLVLPLENLSHDPDQEYFADGLTEDLITALAKISALRVVSRTTAMHYKGTRKPLRQIASELNVDAIVEGMVRRSGERVRVSTQLIDASTDTHLWAETYDRDLRDILALQSEVAEAISRRIEVVLTPQEQARLTRVRQVLPEAYEAYLKGRYLFARRTPEAMSRAIAYFERAIGKDPQYAAAYAGLADSIARSGWWGYVPPDDGCGRAISFAQKAVEIDDTLAEGHAALSFALLHYKFSFSHALAAGRHAVELDSRSSLAAQSYACCLLALGRLDDAVAEALRAVQLDPPAQAPQWIAGVSLYIARQYDRALLQSRSCLELDPAFPPPRWTIAATLAATQSDDSDIPQLEEAIRICGNNQVLLGGYGHWYAASGRPVEARTILDLLQEASRDRYVSAYWPAVIHASLGATDEAFRLLELACRERAPWLAYTKVQPFHDGLRSDPRFDDLLRRIGFPAT
jgi:TolB-like protein